MTPPAEYLRALPPWDGILRLDYFFTKRPNARAFKGLVRDMVKRAFTPGCLIGPVTVIQGPQATGKSRFLRTLAGEDRCHQIFDIVENDPPFIENVWLLEWCDIASNRRFLPRTSKHFSTARHDSTGEHRYPRGFVLVGTTNEAISTSRRLRVIRTRVRLPVKRLARDRDQLFAEALAAYDARRLNAVCP